MTVRDPSTQPMTEEPEDPNDSTLDYESEMEEDQPLFQQSQQSQLSRASERELQQKNNEKGKYVQLHQGATNKSRRGKNKNSKKKNNKSQETESDEKQKKQKKGRTKTRRLRKGRNKRRNNRETQNKNQPASRGIKNMKLTTMKTMT